MKLCRKKILCDQYFRNFFPKITSTPPAAPVALTEANTASGCAGVTMSEEEDELVHTSTENPPNEKELLGLEELELLDERGKVQDLPKRNNFI